MAVTLCPADIGTIVGTFAWMEECLGLSPGEIDRLVRSDVSILSTDLALIQSNHEFLQQSSFNLSQIRRMWKRGSRCLRSPNLKASLPESVATLTSAGFSHPEVRYAEVNKLSKDCMK